LLILSDAKSHLAKHNQNHPRFKTHVIPRERSDEKYTFNPYTTITQERQRLSQAFSGIARFNSTAVNEKVLSSFSQAKTCLNFLEMTDFRINNLITNILKIMIFFSVSLCLRGLFIILFQPHLINDNTLVLSKPFVFKR